MQYTEEVVNEKKIIVARIMSDMKAKDIALKTIATRTRAKNLGFGVLVDFRKVNNLVAIIEAFHWIEKHYDRVDPSLRHVSAAHITLGKDKDFLGFLETAWQNRGVMVRLFSTEKQALNWLEDEVQSDQKDLH